MGILKTEVEIRKERGLIRGNEAKLFLETGKYLEMDWKELE